MSIGLGAVLSFAFVVATLGCVSELPEPRSAFAVSAECPPAGEDDDYHAPGTVAPTTKLDLDQRRAYARYLRAAAVPSLSCGDEPREGYRFLWLPATLEPVILVDVTNVAGEWRFRTVEFRARPAGLHELQPRNDRAGKLDAAQVNEVQRLLTAAQFWTRPAWAPSSPETFDGRTWVVEGRVDSSHRIVTYSNPEDEPFMAAAGALLTAAGLPIPRGMLPRRLR